MKRLYCFLFMVLSLTTVFAGNGTIAVAPANPHGIRGVMNFTINFRYLPTDAEVNNLIGEIETANDILCDATDGQVVFGNVTITTGTTNEDAADIWVPIFSSRSYAAIDGLNTAGSHITLFRDDLDGRTIAHELGHLAYGIHDEYGENCRSGGCGIGACILGSEDANNTSLMDNYWQLSDFSEFCTAANHDQARGNSGSCNTPASCADEDECDNGFYCPGFNTNTGNYESTIQQLAYNQSGWDRMVEIVNNRYGIGMAAPANVTAAQPGFCDFFLDIDNEANSTDLAVLVMDVSGSMAIKDAPIPSANSEADRLEYAKKAAEIFVNLNASRGDLNLGVVDFNDIANRTHNMEILDFGNDQDFISDINGLASGGSTAIGNGLMEARFMMEGQEGTNPTIFLLSDGESNVGLDPITTADLLQSQGYRVFTIPVGNGADRTTLSEIAMTTGGEMADAHGGDDLLPIYAEMAAKHRGNSLVLPRLEYSVCDANGEHCPSEGNQQPEESFIFPVEKNAKELVLILTNRNPIIQDWQPTFELQNTVTGQVFTEKDKQFLTDDIFYKIFRVPTPDPYDWKLVVKTRSTNAANYGHILAYVENPNPDLFVDCEPRIVPKGEKTIINAKALFVSDLDDSKVQYTGYVTRPDGSVVPINFSSDWLENKTSAPFGNMLGRGIYEVRVRAQVADGSPLLEGESIMNGDPVPPVDVTGFERFATTSFFYDTPDFGECQDNDCDGDKIPNDQEDETCPDCDGDGIPNSRDEDSDGDDIPDIEEGTGDRNQNGKPDYLDPAINYCNEQMELKTDVYEPDCNQANGTIVAYVENGSGAYSYDWSHDPNLNSEKATDLPAGVYWVKITDLQYNCQLGIYIILDDNCLEYPGINCANAIDVDFGEEYRYNLTNFNDRWSDYNCTERSTKGNEMLFRIDMESAGTLDLKLENESGGNSKFNMYLLDDCSSSACIDLTQKAELPAGTYYVVIEDTSFSGGDFSFSASAQAALPLTWLSVTGKATKMGNKIEWEVAEQVGISHYIIERQPTDNQRFENIGKVGAQSRNANYTFMDDQPTASNLYRIKAVELSGAERLSNTVYLEERLDISNALTIAPVPASSDVQLRFNSQLSQSMMIQVTDITGKIILQRSTVVTAGQQVLDLDVHHFENGIYLVQLRQADGQVMTKRMVIQR
ncbi:MAG: VWA domain-containing protein [Saprospiraceae bacterium]